MAEKCTEFLAQVAQPLVERAGFAVFGITQDFDMLGVQVIVPDEDEPAVFWVKRSDVESAMGSYGPGELVRQIQASLTNIQRTSQEADGFRKPSNSS